MTWMLLAIGSAGLLGVYDIVKKDAANGNAVPVVLWVSSVIGAAIWSSLLLGQFVFSERFADSPLLVQPLSCSDHLLLAGKSLLVGCSWTASLFALKHLPLSIATPIRSTSPLMSITMAIAFLAERPSATQWVGILIVILAFGTFSMIGKTEGIRFTQNRWVGLMVLATFLGALSSIYDKVLLQRLGYSVATVQAYFTLYMVPVMTPLAIHWWIRNRSQTHNNQPFEFRLCILGISPLLLVADWLYFSALRDPDALVSVVSTLRRSSVVVVLVLGAPRLGEVNLRRKSMCVAGLLCGVALVLWGD